MFAHWTRSLVCTVLLLIALTPPALAQGEPKFDFAASSPLEFIEFLKTNTNQIRSYTVQNSFSGWIVEDDIPKLLNLLDSKEPCMGVKHSAGSYIPGMSTVGDQAGFMILAFQKRYYPPALNTSTLTDEQKQALRSWWRIYRESINVARDRKVQ